jgi:hypothetical protein
MISHLLLLLCSADLALEPVVQLEVTEHQPVVIEANLEIEPGWQVLFDWDVDKPARAREVDNGKVVHIWAPPGRYEIELSAILVNWDTRELKKQEQTTSLVILGDDSTPPDPGPTPDPAVPEDEFNNLAQAIAAKGKQLGISMFKGEVAANYRQVAARLEGSQDPLIPTIPEAATEIIQLNNQFLDSDIPTKNQYRELAAVIAPRWDGAWPRDTVVRFFRAIADGLDAI